MKGKSQNNNVRNRTKGQPKHENNDNKKEVVTNNDSSKAANGKVEAEHRAIPEGNCTTAEAFSARLSSLFRDTNFRWMKELCERELNQLIKINHNVDRMSYFSKELVISLFLVTLFAVATRLYQVESPRHVWQVKACFLLLHSCICQ